MRYLLLVIVLISAFGQLPQTIGSELDPNQIKPSDVKIEQRKVFTSKVIGAQEHAKQQVSREAEIRQQAKLADAGIIDSQPKSEESASMNSWEVTAPSASDNMSAVATNNTPEDIEERHTEQLEEQLEAKQHESQLQELPEWVRKEQESLSNFPTPNLLEQFQFILEDANNYSFVLDSTNKTDTDNRIYLEFFIYTLSDSNQYIVPNRPAQATYLQLTVSPTVDPRVGRQAKIYVHSKMEIPTRPIYYLHFLNQYDRTIFVIARVEFMNKRITPISKENIDPTAAMLSNVAESFKNKKVTYKWDMGFKEQAETHESTLLWLTGFELLAIIVTTLLQVGCLKQLIDNRSIV